MSKNWQLGLVVAALILGAALVGAILLSAGVVLWQVVAVSDASSKVSDILEKFADDQIDAGYEDPELHSTDPLLSDRKVFLGHTVNARTAKDVATRLFYLNSVDSSRPIDLYISTLGGWTDNAFTIIDAMRMIEAPVNTWAIGGCYSAGALILTSGTGRRIATDDAIVMIHSSLEDSTEEYSSDALELARYENVWRKTAELPASWYPMTSDKEYYLTAKQALELKVIDEVVSLWSDHPRAR